MKDRGNPCKKDLSKDIWQLNTNHAAFDLAYEIADYTSPYKYGTLRCNFCLTEKYFIIKKEPLIQLSNAQAYYQNKSKFTQS